MNKNIWTSASLIFLAGAASVVQAQAAEEGSPLTDKFTISVGTFLLSTSTKVTLNGTAGATASEVDLKKDLGLRDADRIRVDGDTLPPFQ